MNFRSLIFIASLFFSISVCAQATYHCVDFNQADFEGSDLLNSDVKGKKIIMIGEFHHWAANSIVQTELFRHLNKHFGVRHLLIEFGGAEAYLFNQYLETGDDWYLNHTFSGYGYLENEEFFSSWKRLYEYNLGLDNSKKLIVHGLDFEREPGLSASLYKLLSAYKNNPQISGFATSIKIRLDTIGIKRNTKEFIYYLRERVSALPIPNDENKKLIEDIIGNDLFFSGSSVGPERDKQMAQKFLALDTSEEVYLGQFGFVHTMLDQRNMLTGYLNSLDKYHDKILVISMQYLDLVNTHGNNLVDNFIKENPISCPNFIYRINSSDGEIGKLKGRMDWMFFLRNQKLLELLPENRTW